MAIDRNYVTATSDDIYLLGLCMGPFACVSGSYTSSISSVTSILVSLLRYDFPYPSDTDPSAVDGKEWWSGVDRNILEWPNPLWRVIGV